MKDTNRPVRKAFYQLLNKQLVIEGSPVPVSDKQTKKLSDNNFYVILSSQTSTPDNTKTSNDVQATITLDIITKFENSVTSDIADDIANQIFILLFPFTDRIHRNALPVQSGFQFLNLRISNDTYLNLQLTPTQHALRRILTFSLRVVY